MTGSHIFGALFLAGALGLVGVCIRDWAHRGEDWTPIEETDWDSFLAEHQADIDEARDWGGRV